MTKPRIEEIMNEAEMMFGAFLTVEASYDGEDISLNAYMRNAIIETYKQGVEDAVEVCKKIQYDGCSYEEDGTHYCNGYEKALDDTIKALQDNK